MVRFPLLAMLTGAGVLALLVRIALAFPDLEAIREGAGPPPAKTAATQAAPPKRLPIDVSTLSCFECHNYKRYESGAKFSHTDHSDIGHCHVCHAFEGHMMVSIRKEACVDCHDEEAEQAEQSQEESGEE